MVRILTAALIGILLLVQGLVYADAAPQRWNHSAAISKLGLSKARADKLLQSLQRNRAVSDRTKDALAVERKRLSSVYDDYRLDEGRARNSIRRINRLQLDLLNLSLRRQIELRSMLNEDQRKQLRGAWKKERQVRESQRPSRERKLPDLNLAPDQQQAVERLWKEGMKNRQAAVRKLANDTKAIQQLYDNDRLDERAARRLIAQMNKSQLQLGLSRLNWQLQIREILSEQQFNALVASRPKRDGRGPR